MRKSHRIGSAFLLVIGVVRIRLDLWKRPDSNRARALHSPRVAWARCWRNRPHRGTINQVTNVATPKDLAHFAAIRTAEEASEEDRLRRAAETPPGERMLRGSRLGAELPWTPALLAEADARADGQMELARRRIAMGLRGR